MANQQEERIDMQNPTYDNAHDLELLCVADMGNNIPTDPKIRDWTIPAMFSLCYCCCSVGMCATYYAFRANYNTDKGNLRAARQHTKKAKILTLVSIGVGSVLLIIAIIAIAFIISSIIPTINNIMGVVQATTNNFPH